MHWMSISIGLFIGVAMFAVEPEFGTSELTIEHYYKSMEENDLEGVNSCFWNNRFNSNSIGKFWISYKIVNKKIYNLKSVNEFKETIDFEYNENRDPILNDVEIIVATKVKNNKRIKVFKFRYLLRYIHQRWLIVSHSALMDYD